MKLFLEDLVANAIIELYRNNGIKQITAIELQRYIKAIQQYLQKKKIIADCSITKEEFLNFQKNYENTFITYNTATTVTYLLQDGITIGELIEQFRGHYDEEEVSYFTNPVVLESLGIVPIEKKPEIHILASYPYLLEQGCPICGNKNFKYIQEQDILSCPNKNCNTIFYTNPDSIYDLTTKLESSIKDLDIRIVKDTPSKMKRLTFQIPARKSSKKNLI